MVVDQTGLDGHYDFELKFAADLAIAPPVGVDARERSASTDAPSIFTAVREQLGLKLDLRNLSLEFLNVERAERPAGN